MKKSEFSVYLEEQIFSARTRISPKLSKSDRVDSGRLDFLTALKNVVDGAASPEDFGTVGAVNDVLQELELLSGSETLLARLKP
ncbi:MULTISPECIES: hypothetical protein [Pseudomonas fluorescens group]|uniref:Uncharacterized protein n=1 Tax=Pseudomonas fluorescens TaxID=294 RepID=A0A0D0TAL9_PSEFL|nr:MULTISPECIES: hypothetical protein [Pseudomonas fluorescens group]AZE60458.1 hypothetical protein C4K02_2095 [Pseudomonas synxantha]KIR20621.1 hypothetical protein PFLU3_39430 [Pseudomonas fluorescens]MCK3831178.1 hypothetical protein [Pseudomonas fluorescens]